MRSLTTYLSSQESQLLVSYSGNTLRAFLDFLLDYRAGSFLGIGRGLAAECMIRDGELKGVLSQYKANPGDFSDEALVRKGADAGISHRVPVRIEVRETPGVEGASQIAIRGLFGDYRVKALESFRQLAPFQSGALTGKTSGEKSLEFNVSGVGKALPIRYIQSNFFALLEDIGYTPGPGINAAGQKFIFMADGDGTLYGKPTIDELPSLAQSPAYRPLLEYLDLGGLFVLISGNSLARVEGRIAPHIPANARTRVLVSANGGADLAVVTLEGRLKALDHYRKHALEVLQAEKNADNGICAVYAGDDTDASGNDFEAFEAVGWGNAICVGAGGKGEVGGICVGGHEQSTAKCLELINEHARAGKPLTAEVVRYCVTTLKG